MTQRAAYRTAISAAQACFIIKLTDRKKRGSRCYFLYPKCTKSHIRKINFFSGNDIPGSPLKGDGVRVGRREGREGREWVLPGTRPSLEGNQRRWTQASAISSTLLVTTHGLTVLSGFQSHDTRTTKRREYPYVFLFPFRL